MSITNGTKITPPVGVSDVRKVLGESSNDVGTLCTSNKICRYSRKKPYAFGTMIPLTDAQRITANYGMTPVYIPSYTTPTSNLGIAPWGQWRLPATDEWKRLTDFDGYIHNSKRLVTAVRIYSTAGEQYTTPIYSDNTDRQEGLIGEVDLSDTEGLRFEDFKLNDGTNIGNLYLTLLLLSQDAGGLGTWVAQSDRPIRQYSNDTARVYMFTTRIDRSALRTLGANFVAIGLGSKIKINEDYTSEAFATSGFLLSMDMWADSLKQVVYNDDTVEAGSGGAGGPEIVIYVDFYGSFNYTPPLGFSFRSYQNGTAYVDIGSRANNLVTWRIIPTGYDLPKYANLYVDVELSATNGNAQNTQSFLVPRIASGNGILVIDNSSFQLDTSQFVGRGTITTKVTFRMGAENNTSTHRYRFFDADNPNAALSVTYDGASFDL